MGQVIDLQKKKWHYYSLLLLSQVGNKAVHNRF